MKLQISKIPDYSIGELKRYLLDQKENIPRFRFPNSTSEVYKLTDDEISDFWSEAGTHCGIYKAWYGLRAVPRLCEAFSLLRSTQSDKVRETCYKTVTEIYKRLSSKNDGSLFDWTKNAFIAISGAPFDPFAVALLCSVKKIRLVYPKKQDVTDKLVQSTFEKVYPHVTTYFYPIDKAQSAVFSSALKTRVTSFLKFYDFEPEIELDPSDYGNGESDYDSDQESSVTYLPHPSQTNPYPSRQLPDTYPF